MNKCVNCRLQTMTINSMNMNIVVVVFFVCLFISKTATYKCQKIRLISFHMSVALIFIHLFIFTTVSNTYT